MIALAMLAAPAGAAECLGADAALTGRMAMARGQHPTQGAFNALQLRFAQPTCLRTAAGEVTVRVLDLAPANADAKHRLREEIGYRVTVRGAAIERPSTPFHIAEAVLTSARLVRRER
jgi:hypothetical protein